MCKQWKISERDPISVPDIEIPHIFAATLVTLHCAIVVTTPDVSVTSMLCRQLIWT